MTGGRPLRFLLVVLCGWTAARGVDRYGMAADPPDRVAPLHTLAAAIGIAPAAAAPAPALRVSTVGRTVNVASDFPAVHPRRTPGTPPAVRAVPIAAGGQEAPPPPLLPGAVAPARSAALAIPGEAIRRAPSRWAGSVWTIVRNGAAIGLPGSQLGGSQAGVRVTYALTDDRRLALAARVSAPLAGRGREAAVGIDWQPTRLPVHLLAEQRVSLDGGRGGPTLAVIGGFGPAPVTPGVDLEGYGQAGVIARDGGEAFADGALRATHPVAAIGGVRIDAGAGTWGGAQRGAARLDVGPSLGVVVPVGRQRIRLTADWRQRIAGASRPGSGPALSLGTNF